MIFFILYIGRANTCEYIIREIDMGTQSGWQQWVSASVRLSETPRGSTSRIAAPIGPSPSRSARRRGSPQKRSWSILGCKSHRSSGRPMPWWPPSSGTGRGWRGGDPDKRFRVGEPVSVFRTPTCYEALNIQKLLIMSTTIGWRCEMVKKKVWKNLKQPYKTIIALSIGESHYHSIYEGTLKKTKEE